MDAATLSFSINLIYANAPTAAEEAAFENAKATWESIIVGYQIDDIQNTTVDITVNLAEIDGVGGVLGSAGPTYAKLNAAGDAVTSNFLYTQAGTMTFDTADTPGLGSDLSAVILHEMGHVLGIGILWSSSAVGFPGRQELYVAGSGQYTGAAGVAAYNSEFSQSGTFVPVELGGGPGTAEGHWNEVDGGAGNTGIVSNITGKDFMQEIMTGWLNSGSFISTLTTQSMVDMGYVVVPEPLPAVSASLGLMFLLLRRRR
jgi:hypothetical protein